MADIVSKPASDAYRDGWDRVFRGPSERAQRLSDAAISRARLSGLDAQISGLEMVANGIEPTELEALGWRTSSVLDGWVRKDG